MSQETKRTRERLSRWERDDYAGRLFNRDHTLWSKTKVPELEDRLGWLDLPSDVWEQVPPITRFVDEIKKDGARHVVLLGMGGSSLAPEVFQKTFGNAPGHPELIVLDSTHPDAVRAVEARIDLERTLFIVSSKSGTTTETLSFHYYFWDKVCRLTDTGGRRFAAITDPDSSLEELARDRMFRHVFQAPPDVGGRYSALSVFGLVPAALVGVDLKKLLAGARDMIDERLRSYDEDSPLGLGAAMGEYAAAGRNKLTITTTKSLAAFPAWIEQLLAESTGKDRRGILPVVDEPLGSRDVYGGADRVFVHIALEGEEDEEIDGRLGALAHAGHPVIRVALDDRYDLGREFVRWEAATAAASSVLGIHPFNQPDVQLAKKLAKEAMAKRDAAAESPVEQVTLEEPKKVREALDDVLMTCRPGDFVALHAYLAPTPEASRALQGVRMALRDKLRVATTLGYGPRFLHSTGQFHKGGPNTGIFLQIVDDPADAIEVPETDYTFNELIRAQADGDAAALIERDRRVLRIAVGSGGTAGLETLAAELRT